ncbi:hypothetical protein [Nostoc sp. 106C]|jgi:hypothetical protein|uniref:hypothetical protein n=1 Tax=Nostoc sp. 106C TaxID=1932667 RepID=UPI000A3B5B5E|nr:hypothetical protein [Nostoc sp. 106C]OUL20456.1 hypothetical protein BV375_30865 [Nostoc sp. 106C]OUL25140.1 hypothetical protein BV378_16380 [Nostoc sp. RF31YmG]
MITDLKHKLNARSKYQLERGNLSGDVEVLIRTQRPPNHDQQKQMREAGYRQRTRVGNVLSGVVIDVCHLENLAKLPFVRKIELSTPMFQES